MCYAHIHIGNVIFASALDCWGFSLTKFTNIWANKLNINKNILHKYMFDDYYYNSKTKKICKYDPSTTTDTSTTTSNTTGGGGGGGGSGGM